MVEFVGPGSAGGVHALGARLAGVVAGARVERSVQVAFAFGAGLRLRAEVLLVVGFGFQVRQAFVYQLGIVQVRQFFVVFVFAGFVVFLRIVRFDFRHFS